MKHLTDTQLNEYLDGALDALTKRDCDAHLVDCDACRARLHELQRLFADLSALPEVSPSRDLTAAVLRRLPSKPPRPWTPAFAAQLGAAIGASLWLSVQLTKFAPPVLASLRPPHLSLPHLTPSFPTFNLQLLTFDILRFAVSIFQPAAPNFLFAFPELPHLQIPPDLRFDTPFGRSALAQDGLSGLQFALMVAAVSLLWIIGNVSLLRKRSEAKS